jgi:sarcosine oxidase delta subunit
MPSLSYSTLMKQRPALVDPADRTVNRSVDCPICPSKAEIRQHEDNGVFRIEGYYSLTEDQIEYTDPDRTLGAKLYLTREVFTRRTASCDQDHVLLVFLAHYVHLPVENTLYSPPRTPTVDCPHCPFSFGNHDEFEYTAEKERLGEKHILTSVTEERKPSHTEVNSVTPDVCLKHDAFSVRKTCPHCNDTAYFNYRRRGEGMVSRHPETETASNRTM